MFDKLKSMVWTSDEPSAAPTAAPAPQAPVQQAPMSTGFQFQNEPSAPVDPVLDVEGIRSAIVGVIEQQPAFADFVKFTTATAALEKVIPIEGVRMQAAQATCGLTKEQLLASVGTFVGVLEGEAQNFNQSYVAAAEQNIQLVTNEVNATDAEIQALTTKLAELSARRQELVSDGMNKSSELAKAKIDFDSIQKSITARYTDAANKIQQFLTA
jgi:hypothetical protein